MSDYIIVDGELYHYGVMGMKWRVHRARYKQSSSERLRKKALDYDAKSAALNKKSEKIHATKDLGRSNSAANKTAKYNKKAAKLGKKALKTDNELLRSVYESRAETAKYKAAKAKIDANMLSKTTGYGIRAMKYSIKSDVVAKKAAKARMKVANNERYVAKMKQKISTLSKEDLSGAYSFVNELMKN